MSEWWGRTYLGSSECMDAIPNESIQCIVTSPPYFGLRDYGVDSQIGGEPTVLAFIDRLCSVFDECWRVLRHDGLLFVNMGDSYFTGAGGTRTSGPGGGAQGEAWKNKGAHVPLNRLSSSVAGTNLKPKDLMMVPARLALALQDRGWWLRDDIIWHKPNPMPSSVDDRCTPSYEHIFMLAKSARYFCDMDAVRTADSGRPSGNGFIRPERLIYGGRGQEEQWEPGGGANLRNVWTIATNPYADAHFATFPKDLPARCIQMGSSEFGRCSECGAPRIRKIELIGGPPRGDHSKKDGVRDNPQGRPEGNQNGAYGADLSRLYAEHGYPERKTVGSEPSCAHDAPTIPCVVLDPFMGSGTTAQVAESLGRRWVGYELNPIYHDLIAERTRQKGLFAI